MKKAKIIVVAAVVVLLSACSTSRGCGCLSLETAVKTVVELIK
jgi:hypothetical protein